MTFSEFSAWREQLLTKDTDLLDCGDTNLYRALDYVKDADRGARCQHAAPIHRCDLARLWLERFGFPAAWSRRALVCRVRHALSLLFRVWSPPNCTWWVPEDVYPVYFELARAGGVEPRTYKTLPQGLAGLWGTISSGVNSNWKKHVKNVPHERAASLREILLVPNPLKPLGRYLTDSEVDALAAWLIAADDRLVVVDSAYDLTSDLHATTRRLWETGRAMVLHTFTKGWLAPRTFGIALVPERRAAELSAAFRNDPPLSDQLCLARHCLNDDAAMPQRVAGELQRRVPAFVESLPREVVDRFVLPPAETAPGCYLFPVRISAERLLRDHSLLAVPGTAFGATSDLSILTSLADTFRVLP
jgi:aspartate/methionine/tyrosine aminotransferase